MGLKRFDFKLKDNRKKKSIIVTSIIVLVLLLGVTIYATFAKYKLTKTYNIIQGKVGDFSANDLSIAVKITDAKGENATSATDFPSKDEYYFDADMSTCANESEITFDTENWMATISSSKKDSCTLYFRETNLGTFGKTLVASYGGESGVTKLEESKFATATEDGEFGMYSMEDESGRSYYYRGDVDHNYVKFGKGKAGSTEIRGYWTLYNRYMVFDTMEDCENETSVYSENCDYYEREEAGKDLYWRIVRINGDGSIRLAYDGIDPVENGVEHDNTVYKEHVPYSKNEGVEYLDYTKSNAKVWVDKWYTKHFDSNYYSYLDGNSTFCNDINDTNDDGVMDPADRLSNNSPKLICTSSDSLLSVSNNKLEYPIGMITSDEVIMAGLLYANYETTPLLTSYVNGNKHEYWTMSASYDWDMYNVSINGLYSTYGITTSNPGIRPVINIKSDIDFTGTGKIGDPYILAN